MSKSAYIDIDVAQLERVQLQLSQFDPQLRRELNKRLRKAADVVRAEASATVRSRATTHSRSSRRTASSYRVQVRGSSIRIVGPTLGAFILEFAGKGTKNRKPRGRTLIRTLDERYGKPGRIMWAAFDRHKEQVEADTREAVAWAESQIQRVVDGKY
jgi:hypothetical protein